MSTYTDLHNCAKETLNVDYHTRVTPQKVHFINPENTYQGTFVGNLSVDGENSIYGGTIVSAVVSSSILDNVYFKNGLNIDDIQQLLVDLSAGLEDESTLRSTADCALCSEISTTNFNLDVEKLERKNADDTLSVELTKEINFQAEQSIARDSALNDKIEAEISNRISADVALEKRANDTMLHDRHLEMHLIDNREFPLLIKDFAINTYVDSNANAYVYKNGNIEETPIGRIEKATYEDDKLVSFEFNAFANHPDTYELTGAGIFQYCFDKDNTVRYTNVGGYRIGCDVSKATSLNDMLMILDSANNDGYYNVYFDQSTNKAGQIGASYKCDASGMISSCALTITSQQLSNFILTTPFNFVANGETKTFKGKNGNWCEATLSDNVFSFYDKHLTRYFIPVRNAEDDTLFGRIYDGNVILDYDESLKEIDLNVDGGKYFILNKSNDFTQTFDAATPYVKISYNELSNIVQIKEEKKYYKYNLNGNAGSLIPGLADVPNKRIDDTYTTVGVTLSVDSPSLAKYVNGDYTLTLVDTVNKYQVEKEITLDNFGKITLTFIKDAKALFVDIAPNATSDFIHLHFDVNNIAAPTEIDMSSTKFTSKKLCDDIKHARIDEKILDEQYDSKYVLIPDLTKKEYSGESKVLIGQAKTLNKDTLTLVMPNKQEQIPYDYSIASSKFILNFKVYTESLQDVDFVSLIIKSHDVADKFYYMNKPVSKIFIKKNKWTSLKFEELRPHHYIINDLDYSEIDYRLNELSNELISHEISSYESLMKLSDDVEFLLSADKEEMSYKGTLPLMKSISSLSPLGETQWSTVYLSDFIAQSPYVYNNSVKLGDMFKLSATQYNHDALYDGSNYIWLGENDYFVVNKHAVAISNVTGFDLDIFRNSESETTFLCVELMHQINATSSFISSEVDRISAELSTELNNCELSVNGLSVEVDRISSELSTELNNCELSVNGLSIEVDRISSELSTELNNCELSVNGLSIEVDRISTELSNELNACELSVNGLSIEVDRISAELSNELNSCELSVNGISVEVDRISAELSIELNNCELSVNGISVEVDRISAELSTELNNCELSVNGLSVRIDELCSELSIAHNFLSNSLSDEIEKLSTSLSNTTRLSVEQLCSEIIANDNDISYLSSTLDFVLSTGHDTVAYQGTMQYYDPLISPTVIDRSLSAFINKSLDPKYNKHLKFGFMFKLSAVQDMLSDEYCNTTYFGADDFFIVNKNIENVEHIHVEDLDVVRNAMTETLRLSVELSTELSACELSVNGLSIEVDRISAELSTELNNCELSVNGLSIEVDRISVELSTELNNCELSVNGLSVEVDRISSELSTELNNCELSVNGLSVEVDRISAELSTELSACELSVNGLSVEVDRISTELSTELNNCELSVNGLSNYVDALELSVNGISVMHNFLSNSLSDEIEKLSTSLSNTTRLSVEQLCSEIIANDNDISTISSDLSVLQYHYDRTFDEKHYTRGSTVKDISVDVLNIVDSDETDNQYTLQFLSGTLVLVKKTI